MKSREKTENIVQTRKTDDARRKTHEKNSDNERVPKKKTFSSSKNCPQKILNLFGPKSRDGDEEKTVKK